VLKMKHLVLLLATQCNLLCDLLTLHADELVLPLWGNRIDEATRRFVHGRPRSFVNDFGGVGSMCVQAHLAVDRSILRDIDNVLFMRSFGDTRRNSEDVRTITIRTPTHRSSRNGRACYRLRRARGRIRSGSPLPFQHADTPAHRLVRFGGGHANSCRSSRISRTD